jgi:hypothetical protein
LTACLALWLLVKLVFVHHLMPARSVHRQARAKGELIARLVPQSAQLYLFRLKDEGILFYFARNALRLPAPTQLPAGEGEIYCILCASEWESWGDARPAEVVQRLTDAQGAPIVLIHVLRG